MGTYCSDLTLRNTSSELNVLQDSTVVCCSVLQCVAVCCSVLQCVAVCCSVLQCVAVCECVTRVDSTFLQSQLCTQFSCSFLEYNQLSSKIQDEIQKKQN